MAQRVAGAAMNMRPLMSTQTPARNEDTVRFMVSHIPGAAGSRHRGRPGGIPYCSVCNCGFRERYASRRIRGSRKDYEPQHEQADELVEKADPVVHYDKIETHISKRFLFYHLLKLN